MIKIVSTSTWKHCVNCGDYRRNVWLAEHIGALCSSCMVRETNECQTLVVG